MRNIEFALITKRLMQFVREVWNVNTSDLRNYLINSTVKWKHSQIYDTASESKFVDDAKRVSDARIFTDSRLFEICDDIVQNISDSDDERDFILIKSDVTQIRYPVGGFFSPHRDYVTVVSNVLEEYTMIICVTDPSTATETSGGETCIHLSNSMKFTSKATTLPGSVLLFRKDLIHEGLPLLSGQKEIVMLNLWCFRKYSSHSGNNIHHDPNSEIILVRFPNEKPLAGKSPTPFYAIPYSQIRNFPTSPLAAPQPPPNIDSALTIIDFPCTDCSSSDFEIVYKAIMGLYIPPELIIKYAELLSSYGVDLFMQVLRDTGAPPLQDADLTSSQQYNDNKAKNEDIKFQDEISQSDFNVPLSENPSTVFQFPPVSPLTNTDANHRPPQIKSRTSAPSVPLPRTTPLQMYSRRLMRVDPDALTAALIAVNHPPPPPPEDEMEVLLAAGFRPVRDTLDAPPSLPPMDASKPLAVRMPPYQLHTVRTSDGVMLAGNGAVVPLLPPAELSTILLKVRSDSSIRKTSSTDSLRSYSVISLADVPTISSPRVVAKNINTRPEPLSPPPLSVYGSGHTNPIPVTPLYVSPQLRICALPIHPDMLPVALRSLISPLNNSRIVFAPNEAKMKLLSEVVRRLKLPFVPFRLILAEGNLQITVPVSNITPQHKEQVKADEQPPNEYCRHENIQNEPEVTSHSIKMRPVWLSITDDDLIVFARRLVVTDHAAKLLAERPFSVSEDFRGGIISTSANILHTPLSKKNASSMNHVEGLFANQDLQDKVISSEDLSTILLTSSASSHSDFAASLTTMRNTCSLFLRQFLFTIFCSQALLLSNAIYAKDKQKLKKHLHQAWDGFSSCLLAATKRLISKPQILAAPRPLMEPLALYNMLLDCCNDFNVKSLPRWFTEAMDISVITEEALHEQKPIPEEIAVAVGVVCGQAGEEFTEADMITDLRTVHVMRLHFIAQLMAAHLPAVGDFQELKNKMAERSGHYLHDHGNPYSSYPDNPSACFCVLYSSSLDSLKAMTEKSHQFVNAFSEIHSKAFELLMTPASSVETTSADTSPIPASSPFTCVSIDESKILLDSEQPHFYRAPLFSLRPGSHRIAKISDASQIKSSVNEIARDFAGDGWHHWGGTSVSLKAISALVSPHSEPLSVLIAPEGAEEGSVEEAGGRFYWDKRGYVHMTRAQVMRMERQGFFLSGVSKHKNDWDSTDKDEEEDDDWERGVSPSCRSSSVVSGVEFDPDNVKSTTQRNSIGMEAVWGEVCKEAVKAIGGRYTPRKGVVAPQDGRGMKLDLPQYYGVVDETFCNESVYGRFKFILVTGLVRLDY